MHSHTSSPKGAQVDPSRFALCFGRSRAFPAYVICGLVALAGCNGGRSDQVHVTGKVLYNDKPVEGAHVMFVPDGGRPASAVTDTNGLFQLGTFDPNDGAILGTHRVTVTKMSNGANADDPYAPRKSELPIRYRRTDTSGLSVEVVADGDNDFLFDLHD